MNPKGSQYTLGAYQVLLKTNKHKRLLVEGKDDKQFFMLLIDEFSRYRNGKIAGLFHSHEGPNMLRFQAISSR